MLGCLVLRVLPRQNPAQSSLVVKGLRTSTVLRHKNVLATLEARSLLQDVWPQGEVASHQLASLLSR